jgi:hypothetical protein
MGMFDNISVADKLPISQEMIDAGLGENSFGFQTKSLHKCLGNYIIQGGRLFQIMRASSDDAFGGMRELLDYHGVINFYTSMSAGNLNFWIEYNATFTHGKLESIVLKEFRISDDTVRQAALEKIFDEGRVNRNLWRNKYCFHTKTWRKVRNLITAGMYNIERNLQRIRLNLP